MSSGGNTYRDCEGVGRPVRVVEAAVVPGWNCVGGDGTGECSVCGRVISQRGGVAKRHKDKRDQRLWVTGSHATWVTISNG